MIIQTVILLLIIGAYIPQIISVVYARIEVKHIQEMISDAANHFVVALEKLELQTKMDKLIKEGIPYHAGLAIADSKYFDDIEEAFYDWQEDDEINNQFLSQEQLYKVRRSKLDKRWGEKWPGGGRQYDACLGVRKNNKSKIGYRTKK
jgi:hypothetical protein